MIAVALTMITAPSFAADTYNIDPSHTYPSFAADHKGLSLWRGKFTKTSGTVVLDRAAKTGSLDIAIDPASIDFGHARMNTKARSADMFNVKKFPTITYKAATFKFDGDKPVTVNGELTMMGVTRPVVLTLNSFNCIMDKTLKREICGADAKAEFDRTEFGLDIATPNFASNVTLAIQVEAIKAD